MRLATLTGPLAALALVACGGDDAVPMATQHRVEYDTASAMAERALSRMPRG